jgi:hypothetical protein
MGIFPPPPPSPNLPLPPHPITRINAHSGPPTFYLLCVPAQKPKITESDVLAQTEIFFLDRLLLKVNIVIDAMTPKNYTFTVL